MRKPKRHLEDGISVWCGRRQWKVPEPYIDPDSFLADPNRCKTCEKAYRAWKQRQGE